MSGLPQDDFDTEIRTTVSNVTGEKEEDNNKRPDVLCESQNIIPMQLLVFRF